ncbi:creatininase family protein [Chloroflexota bacterium]
MKKVLWQEMRRTEIDEAAKTDSVVIIPTGSIEQHGNHLPVNTDINICYSIAKQAAELIEDFPVLVAPPVWWGISWHHMKYPGAITIKIKTYIDLLTEIAVSISKHGFKRILFLNGHGGNHGVISSLRGKLMYEDDPKLPSCVAYSYWKIIDQDIKDILNRPDYILGHADDMETAMELLLQPTLVSSEEISWAPGVIGDPAPATRKIGEKLFKTAVDKLIKLICDYRDGNLEKGITWQRDTRTRNKYEQLR